MIGAQRTCCCGRLILGWAKRCKSCNYVYELGYRAGRRARNKEASE